MMKNTWMFILCLLIGIEVIAQNEREIDKKPNILFIAIDDMNDWTGFLGGHPDAITPNMDKLADKGVNFTQAYCSAPGCSPSRNALLYGIEPFNSGLYPFYGHDIHDQLMNRYVSLPRLLRENGYETFGAGKIHHGPRGDKREWTDYLETESFKKQFDDSKGYQLGEDGKMSFRPTLHPDEQHLDHQVASYGIEQLNQSHEDPFFLAIGIVKPHLPFDAPIRFFEALPESVMAPNINEQDYKDIPDEGKRFRKKSDDIRFKQDSAWQKVRKSYLACISWADYNVGRVLDALEESPYADNTVVVLWSDHGFHLGEKLTFRKFTLWEEANRVPFIIYDPRDKSKGGQVYDEAVSLINVYQTISDFTGIKAPPYVDGTSLRPLLQDPSMMLEMPVITSWGKGNYAVRKGPWRYIHYFDGGEELYNHDADPNEWRNLAENENNKEVKKELSQYLPTNEAPTIRDFWAPWSLVGEDRKYKK
ncbi:MAG: sulfatase [Reichenbachiella sp.]